MTTNNKENLVPGSYRQLKEEFRYHWEEGRIAANKAAENLNDMVSLLKKENPEWSINKIAKKIWIDNEDLDGFSQRTVYNNLDENNKALLDPTKQQNASGRRNNVLEDSVATVQHKVIEDSYITSASNDSNDINDYQNVVYQSTQPITEEENIEPTEEIKSFDTDQQEQQKDSFEVRQLKQQLESSDKTIQELKEAVEQLSRQKIGEGTIGDKFDFKYNLEISDKMLRQIRNNGGNMPLIATAYPDKKTGYVRFDNVRLKESIKKKIIVKQ